VRPIPPKHRKLIDEDPFFKTCIRSSEGTCSGRITIEHCWVYRSRQINEIWAYVPLCWQHHLVDLDKNYNRYISLTRATKEELAQYPRVDWKQKFKYLSMYTTCPVCNIKRNTDLAPECTACLYPKKANAQEPKMKGEKKLGTLKK